MCWSVSNIVGNLLGYLNCFYTIRMQYLVLCARVLHARTSTYFFISSKIKASAQRVEDTDTSGDALTSGHLKSVLLVLPLPARTLLRVDYHFQNHGFQ